MQYNEYKYLFPPRPEQKISSDNLGKYDNGTFIGQPKFDGSNCIVFLNKDFLKIMNRHGEEITNPFLSEIDYTGMYSGNGFMIVCGELLNKNKTGEDGKAFNKKLILWDILCYNGSYLVGSTTFERLRLLETLFPCARMQASGKEVEIYTHICCTGLKGIYKAPSYVSGFTPLYHELTGVQLFEGLVLKRKDAKLSYGYTEKNNTDWQIKARRETKNYQF